MKTRSKKYSLNWRDLIKGAISAIAVPAFVVIQQSIDSGHMEINWKLVAMQAIGGLLAYVKISFFSGDKNK
jgi:hypothetical protein